MNRILILSEKPSDLSDLILKNCKGSEFRAPDKPFDGADFDALCLLSGNREHPITYPSPVRACIERFRATGKPVFAEFVEAIGGSVDNGITETTHHRMVFDPTDFPVEGLPTGAVLDDHNNDCITYAFRNHATKPILTMHGYICAHDQIEMSAEELEKGVWALWWLSDTTLLCAFRLCNFRRARLAPRSYFEALITAILSFLAGEKVTPAFEKPVCSYEKTTVTSAADTDTAVINALDWFQRANMLKNGGKDGAFEGYAHHIKGIDGSQIRREDIRTDCTAETGGAFLFDALLRGNKESGQIADKLFKFCFDWMQEKDGPHKGMIRWSEVSWETCYQDDVARVILPLLFQQYINGEVPYFDEIKAGLVYMMDTTGEDGLRVSRTDWCRLDDNRREELKKPGVGTPCAHYNAFYLAMLALAYRAGADKRFLEVAEKGICSIMATYPNTQRETSETEENCRLLMPLSVLFEVTGKPEYKKWLETVLENLTLRKQKCGAYTEWDTGYRAKCARNHTGECALLANNGDPVVDLLYSNNWLPLAFAHAYLATGEEKFHTLWCEIASFLLSCQIHSDDPLLDGAWTRAFDIKHWESHGVPHDVGWAPCCVETGWTMGEILMGLQFMHLSEKKHK